MVKVVRRSSADDEIVVTRRIAPLRQNGENPRRSTSALADLHWDAKQHRANRRQPVGVREVLESRLIRAQPMAMHGKLLRVAGIDAGGIDRDRRNLAFLKQKIDRIGGKSRKPQVGYIARLVSAKVVLFIGPEAAPS